MRTIFLQCCENTTWSTKTRKAVSTVGLHTLDWDYEKRKVHLSMPGYCSEALQRFRHDCARRTDQPHEHSIPMYGRKIQYAKKLNESPKIGPEDKLFVQQVTGTFLYYARAVDSTKFDRSATRRSNRVSNAENAQILGLCGVTSGRNINLFSKQHDTKRPQ